MTRGFATVLLAGLFADSASAHFFFILRQPDGKNATMIFSDNPIRDEKVETKKIELKAVELVQSTGKSTTVDVQPEAGGWQVPLNSDTSEVRATVEYGVVNRGAGHAIRIRHHARLFLGDFANGTSPTAFDIAPVKVSSGVAFRVTFNGKPVAGVDVTVYEPDSKQMKVLKADANGITPGFAKPGRYSARAMNVDKTPGEFEGRKYLITHSYATVTVEMK